MYVKEFLFLQFIAFITYASLKKLGKEHAAEEDVEQPPSPTVCPAAVHPSAAASSR